MTPAQKAVSAEDMVKELGGDGDYGFWVISDSLEKPYTAEELAQYGLPETLSQEDAQLVLEGRKEELKVQKRVEFGEGITSRIIYEFCDSDFIDQNNYVSTLIRLQEIFFMFKNEMQDEITDDELLHLMKEQFEAEQIATEILLQYDNVKLYNFYDSYDII